ncbi:MAG: hypothetical protein LBM16_03655 [Clostridiales bacterium]|jgi:uncharacterized membrane protein|nr:hypothetical protein [Clostridiales bacterium]
MEATQNKEEIFWGADDDYTYAADYSYTRTEVVPDKEICKKKPVKRNRLFDMILIQTAVSGIVMALSLSTTVIETEWANTTENTIKNHIAENTSKEEFFLYFENSINFIKKLQVSFSEKFFNNQKSQPTAPTASPAENTPAPQTEQNPEHIQTEPEIQQDRIDEDVLQKFEQ